MILNKSCLILSIFKIAQIKPSNHFYLLSRLHQLVERVIPTPTLTRHCQVRNQWTNRTACKNAVMWKWTWYLMMMTTTKWIRECHLVQIVLEVSTFRNFRTPAFQELLFFLTDDIYIQCIKQATWFEASFMFKSVAW